MSRNHHHNASVTSNPAQISSGLPQEGGDVAYPGPGDRRTIPSTVPSVGPTQYNAELYNFEEDTSHHESSFEDLLTPECSSENPLSEHTTPQEVIWEQQFYLQEDTSQPRILDPYGPSVYEATQGVSGSTELHALLRDSEETLPKFVSGEELLGAATLDISTPSSPHTAADSAAMPPNMNHSSTSPPGRRRAGSQTLKVDTTADHTPSPTHKVGAWQKMRAPSPVVMVSSYEAADPQDRTQEHFVQSFGKRSRGSESSVDDVDSLEGHDAEISSTHLMPPDADVMGNLRAGSSHRVGLEPQSRTDDVVPSIKDNEEQRQLDERNADVQTWLATSDAGSEPEDDPSEGSSRRRSHGRRRAHTTGGHVDPLGRVYSDKDIPGPGVLVDVESDDEYFDDVSMLSEDIDEHTRQVVGEYHQSGSPQMSPQALARQDSVENTAFPALEEDQSPELQEPLPSQFFRRGPWRDPQQGPTTSTRYQPGSSNAAAYKFNEEAAKWESASRAATWGTRRRLSESEISSIVEGSQVRHLSLSKRGRERGSSILNKARGLFPRRSSSNIKAESTAEESQAAYIGHAHRSSVGSIKPAQRMPSFGKPKSPSLSTSGAFLAMSGQLAAIGSSNSMTQELDASKNALPLQPLKKQRSKSDVSKTTKSSTPGLAELMTRHGGPPVPTLASPMHEREPIIAAQVIDNEDLAADEDEDDQTDEVAIKMDLEIRAEEIIPTVEGFKDHARKLNPRLEPYLLERIGQEQIKRYKKLVEAKIKHTRSVQVSEKCSSGKFCLELGGEAVLLSPRVSSKDPDATLTQFQINNPGDEIVDEDEFSEGIVTPALFPVGIPIPPVKRLPAEFECQLCFKVKKFQKPSDWTKHVQEDIQPFSCTFPTCPEAKSFKRKADWVRHENERHRHLEWWRCSFAECAHICYRKDNFVQHLVREHKMTEPKVKRGSGSSKNRPVNTAANPEDGDLWRLVDRCRFETPNKPRDEPCRFCGNVCSTFKKLSVHMGKHMEQIAMPVLQLVGMRQVSPDTIVSPIEQPQMKPSSFATLPGTIGNGDVSNVSPYATSATSAYQTSSAGHSPASMPGRGANGGFHFDQAYYSPHTMTPGAHGPGVTGVYGADGNYVQSSPVYMGSSEYMGSGNKMRQAQHESSLSPLNGLVAPRSQPMGPGFENAFIESTGNMYTQGSMPGMFASAPSHSHSHSHPHAHAGSGYLGPYASSMLPSHAHGTSSSSAMGVDGRTGLGLEMMDAQAHTQQGYVYGTSGNGHGGPHLHFS